MSTTTIRLSEVLKARVAKAAKRGGITAHNFILEAIAEKADQAERQAEQRFVGIVASGKAVPWSDMRQYLERRLGGKAARRPAARKLAR